MTAEKLQSDAEARKLATEFFLAAIEARRKFLDHAAKRVEGPFRFRFAGDVAFACTPRVDKAESLLSQRCVALLGPELVHEFDIPKIAWEHAEDHANARLSEKNDLVPYVRKFLRSVAESISLQSIYFAPNHLMAFDSEVRGLEIGPVKACLTEDIRDELLRENWEIHTCENGFEFTIYYKDISEGLTKELLDSVKDRRIAHWRDGHIDVEILPPGSTLYAKATRKFTLPSICWRVEINTSPTNVREEALWLINIAVSLIHLLYPPKIEPPPPMEGQREPHPTRSYETLESAITVGPDEVSVSGFPLEPYYVVTAALVKHFQESDLVGRAKLIFKPKANSIAERMARGLGWMSRGRQSQSRSERFLFFFTAVEALFTADDKNAPVVQTIARHSATVLAEEPTERLRLAKEIRDLYELRSALVHAGRRRVSDSDANRLQEQVECLYRTVLERVDLSIKISTFNQQLVLASYGLRWPPLDQEASG